MDCWSINAFRWASGHQAVIFIIQLNLRWGNEGKLPGKNKLREVGLEQYE